MTPTSTTPSTQQILESLLFASDAPVGLATLVEVLDGPDEAAVLSELQAMARDLEESGRGVALVEIAGGWQLLSRKECAPWIDRMLRSRRKVRLSRAGLETLAIVAYKQPVTKVEIDGIRGVDSSGSLHTLLERGPRRPARAQGAERRARRARAPGDGAGRRRGVRPRRSGPGWIRRGCGLISFSPAPDRARGARRINGSGMDAFR
jgi:segregation and condensation protein B